MLHFPARHGPFHSVVWRAVYNPARHISYSSPSLSTPPEGSPKLTNLTFESIGVRKPIAVALSSAFPHIRHPTETQTRLIPAILSGKDVLLKDETGSGKTLGLLLALLSKPRIRVQTEQGESSTTTSLFIVPHRDLALQVYQWAQAILAHHSDAQTDSAIDIDTVAQLLLRDNKDHLGVGLEKLLKKPPHILISTPQAAMDVYRQHPDALALQSMSTIAVDEVDYLIETVTKQVREPKPKSATGKAMKRIKSHPGDTRGLLDAAFGSRKTSVPDIREEFVDAPLSSAQFVGSSATLSRHLSTYLLTESGWLSKADTRMVLGSQTSTVAPSDNTKAGRVVHPTNVIHSVLVVSEETGIRNVHFAEPDPEPRPDPLDLLDATEEVAEPVPEDVLSAETIAKYSAKPSPINPYTLEAVASIFAMDVPRLALLVIPSSTPVQRAIYDLRTVGVNAYGLDLLVSEGGKAHLLGSDQDRAVSPNPVLLVANSAGVRGLDLPALSHVFVLGIPDGATGGKGNSDTYLHLAGRVGRFGGTGRVVTILEEDEELLSEQSAVGTDTSTRSGWESRDSSRLRNVLRRIGVQPKAYNLFK